MSGGSFYLADSTAVYSDLLALKPGLAKVLTDHWTMVRYKTELCFQSVAEQRRTATALLWKR